MNAEGGVGGLGGSEEGAGRHGCRFRIVSVNLIDLGPESHRCSRSARIYVTLLS